MNGEEAGAFVKAFNEGLRLVWLDLVMLGCTVLDLARLLCGV